jgi:hypothetical protein
VGPEAGVTLVSEGGGTTAGAVKVNPATSVELWVSAFVRTTATVPATCGGVTTVTVLALELTTVAAAAPKATVTGATKPDPPRVTVVPPADVPCAGAMVESVGGGSAGKT